MQKMLLAVAVALGVSVSALSLYAVAQSRALELDLGPLPITEPQLRERLAAAGFGDIYITPRTSLEVLAARNGVTMKLAVDVQSGTVTRMWDDADDDN